MVPVNEVTPEGQPHLLIRDLPPVSSPGAPEISQPRIYFGERPADVRRRRRRQPEFDYPRGNDATRRRRASRRPGAGTTGIRLDTTLSRLLFALRFRDLNLLISDQITSDSQLLLHRSLDDRLPRIAPFLLYDNDPYVVVDEPGKLFYIQDAYTTCDRFPNAQASDPGALRTTGLGGGDLQLPAEQRQGRHGRLRRDDELLRRRPDDPLIRA